MGTHLEPGAGGNPGADDTAIVLVGVAPLDRRCEACDGYGYVCDPDWDTWFQSSDELRRRLGQGYLDSEEWRQHEAAEPGGPVDIGCGECDGAGHILTDAGRAILALLERHPR